MGKPRQGQGTSALRGALTALPGAGGTGYAARLGLGWPWPVGQCCQLGRVFCVAVSSTSRIAVMSISGSGACTIMPGGTGSRG